LFINFLVILELLSPESKLWVKIEKSKILHPKKEYFFSAFLGLVIVG